MSTSHEYSLRSFTRNTVCSPPIHSPRRQTRQLKPQASSCSVYKDISCVAWPGSPHFGYTDQERPSASLQPPLRACYRRVMATPSPDLALGAATTCL